MTTLSILHVAQPSTGGVARCVLDLAVDQRDRGYDVAVATPAEGALAENLTSAGIAVLPWSAHRELGLRVVGELSSLRRIVLASRPDLLHLHSSKAGLARLVARRRIPTVFQPHGWSFEALSGPLRRCATIWERTAARWTDTIVCMSNSERVHGSDNGIGASWRIVPNGVDLEALSPASPEERAAARARIELGPEPLVVCLGRLGHQKGQDLLLDAWPLVRERVPEAELVFVGEGPDGDALRGRAVPGVAFAGERDDVPDWLAAANVVAAPSRWEGMSLVMLEAMARARSVVMTDVSGARDALGKTAGAIVPIGDRQALADALIVRLTRPELADAEGRAGRERVERSHDVRATSDGIVEVYHELLGFEVTPHALTPSVGAVQR